MTDTPTFMSEDEMFQDLMKDMPPGTLLDLAAVEVPDLALLHLSLGMSIRNHYNLWHEDNPHTNTLDPVTEDGVITDRLFPDAVSSRLIKRVWKAMQ